MGADWGSIRTSDADSVELKLLLAADPDAAAGALTGRPSPRWRVRQVHLLDTPDLALAEAGLEMRLRRRPRGRYDLAVRVRQRGAGSRPRPPSGARVELDVLPGAAWRTTELRRDLDDEQTADWVAGRAVPFRLLSPAQEDWTRQYLGPAWAGRLADTLTVHGPLAVHRLTVPSRRFPAARAHLEHCRYPGGSTLVELSARCPPWRAPTVASALCELLGTRGIVAATRHRTKTAVWVDDLVRARRRPRGDEDGD